MGFTKLLEYLFAWQYFRGTLSGHYTKTMATPVIDFAATLVKMLANSDPRLLLFTVQYKAPKIYSKEASMYINISP